MKTYQETVRRRIIIALYCLFIVAGPFDAFATILVGDRVQANGTVNVRPSPAGTPVSGQQTDTLGAIISGPQTATLNGTSYTWYQVDFDTGVNGWVADSSPSIGLIIVTPSAPTQSSPGGSSSVNPVVSSLTPTFNWVASKGASVGYGLYIRDLTASGTPLVFPNAQGNTTSPLVGTSYVLPAGYLVYGHNYVWNMTAFDSAGEGSAIAQNALYFKTPTAPAPSVSTTAATSVTSTSAQINGTVNPNGSDTSVYFEFGLTTSYGSQTSPGDAGSGTTAVNCMSTLSGLQPNTTYHYQLIGANSGGSNLGGDQSFETSAGAPGTPSTPTPADGTVLNAQPTTLSWAQTPNATDYDVYLAIGDGAFAQVGSNLPGNQWSPNETYNATAFSWYVVAKNSTGSTPGPTWSYTINPSQSPGSIQIGSRVMASSDGANVRDSQLDSPALFAQAGGVHGTVIAGPRTGSAANFTGNWWQIEWDSEPPAQNGNNGWTAESVILLAPTAGDVPEPVLTSSYYTTQNAFFPTFAPSVIGGSLGSLGNCTWYAYGRMLERGYSQSLLNDFALHNADTWATDASGVVGVTVDTTPTVDSIAELDSGSFSTLGHVAVVESVNSDGTVTVTESSDKADITSVWDFTWHHRTVAASWFSHFIHVTKNSGGGSAPVISNPVLTGTTFSISVPTQTGTNYVLEYKNSMSDVNWTPIETNGGNGAAISLIDTQTPSASRFYRVRLK